MKNLVLGVAKGYGWYDLESFVNSFTKNCSSAELVLFVDDISDFTRDRLIRAGVSLKNFPYKIEGIPNNTRWKIFRDFTEAHGDEYEQIFITDTRDVIFQSDVFEQFKGLSNWLGCVTEVDDIRGSKTGNSDNYRWIVNRSGKVEADKLIEVNYRWIADCFGKIEADKLADEKTICCGTVIGSATEIKIFCREMWKILEHKTADIFDQATMNYLAYNGLLPIENLFEINVHDGAIFTYGVTLPGDSRDGLILRGDGGIPAVVHQYDRHEELLWLVNDIYLDKNFSFDKRFTDMRSLFEQCCGLLLINKIDEVAEIVSNAVFNKADLKNSVNNILKIWKFVCGRSFTRSSEIIELAVQNALYSVGVNELSLKQLEDVQKVLAHSTKYNHAVDNKLKFSFANLLFKFVKAALEKKSEYACFLYIDWLNQLELPPDKNFQRVVDEAKRIFGRDG